MKRHPTEQERILAKYLSGKELKYKIEKEFRELIKRKKNAIKKWTGELNRLFSKQTANRHLERSSTSLIIRKIQVKTNARYNFTPFRMTIMKGTIKNKC